MSVLKRHWGHQAAHQLTLRLGNSFRHLALSQAVFSLFLNPKSVLPLASIVYGFSCSFSHLSILLYKDRPLVEVKNLWLGGETSCVKHSVIQQMQVNPCMAQLWHWTLNFLTLLGINQPSLQAFLTRRLLGGKYYWLCGLVTKLSFGTSESFPGQLQSFQ